MHASDSLAAFDGSFAAGLLEAMGRLAADPALPVVLIAYDAPYPEPLYATRPVPDAFAVGLVLTADGTGPTITVSTSDAQPDTMDVPSLESIRAGIPAARSLPLLARLASSESGRAVLEYLDGLSLALDVRP
jgi:hypothetical protein